MVELEYKLLDLAGLVKPGQVGQLARSRPMVVLRARGSPKSRFPESRVPEVGNYHKKRGILLGIKLSRISQRYYIKIVLERTKMNAKTRQKSDILISGILDSRNLVMCQVFSFLGSDMQKLSIIM